MPTPLGFLCEICAVGVMGEVFWLWAVLMEARVPLSLADCVSETAAFVVAEVSGARE